MCLLSLWSLRRQTQHTEQIQVCIIPSLLT